MFGHRGGVARQPPSGRLYTSDGRPSPCVTATTSHNMWWDRNSDHWGNGSQITMARRTPNSKKTPSELSFVLPEKCIRVYALNGHQECDFSHFLTTPGLGHAVDSPLSSVWSYICPQHSYNLRSCVSHLDGLYVFLFKHPCKSQAIPTPKGHQFHMSVG